MRGRSLHGEEYIKKYGARETGVKASNLSAESGFDVDEIGSIYYVGGFVGTHKSYPVNYGTRKAVFIATHEDSKKNYHSCIGLSFIQNFPW